MTTSSMNPTITLRNRDTSLEIARAVKGSDAETDAMDTRCCSAFRTRNLYGFLLEFSVLCFGAW